MGKTGKFLLTTAWILFSRGYDAYATNQLTPDLSKESNPLVSVLGMTWTPLLLTLGVLTVYALYTYYLVVFRPVSLLPKEKGYTLSNIFAYTYLGRKDNWTSIFYKLPGDAARFNHYMGHILTRCLVFAGAVSTTMWLLINHTDFYKKIHNPVLIYAVLITGCLLIIYRWSQKQYEIYLQG